MLTRILIADDHESVIRTVRTLLEANPDWKVCGEAVDGREAVAKALELRPDIILLDLAMPTLNGLSAAHEISEALPNVPIILHTLYRYPQVDAEAQKRGIRRVVKKASPSTLVSAIQELVNARVPGTEGVPQVAAIPPAAGSSPATLVSGLSAVEASAPETTPSNVTPSPDNVVKAGWTSYVIIPYGCIAKRCEIEGDQPLSGSAIGMRKTTDLTKMSQHTIEKLVRGEAVKRATHEHVLNVIHAYK